MLKVIENAVRWAAPVGEVKPLTFGNYKNGWND